MLDLTVSKQIILDNYSGKKGTFLASLNDESCFRTELYWELYESVAALAKQREYSEELAAQISFVYQRMLKEMIWHFSPADSSVIADMPENYQDYIDRMDIAVEAYMRRLDMLDDAFEMAVPERTDKDSGIRVMTIDDYEKVYALWMSCKNMGFNNLDDSRDGIAKYLRRNPATCFVAEQGDNIVGVILSGHDGRRGFIHHLAVAEDCRRQGIATELLECAVASLAAEGINKVALFVFNRNEAGNAFWEKNGFTRREDLVYRNKALVEMVRIDT